MFLEKKFIFNYSIDDFVVAIVLINSLFFLKCFIPRYYLPVSV